MTTPEENPEMTTSDELRKWAERNAPDTRIVGSMIIFNPDMDDPPSPEDMAWNRLAHEDLLDEDEEDLCDEDDAEEKG